ncbi:hypothetical protein AAK684_01880 [Leptogranulimonas caecicola]|uniref:hypothetical protein n=1 Tax=Leptogranulimonas caecicola TaxID=2894156 RepID=UPI001BEE22CB|nr:hypothetical protein ATOBIA_N10560 [Atopobiaceae bacterium P1]
MTRQELFLELIDALSNIPGLTIEPIVFVEEARALDEAYPALEDLTPVVVAIIRAMKDLAAGRVSSSSLSLKLEGARSYHFQKNRSQGEKTELRIVYRILDNGALYILAFGNRWRPEAIYRRAAKHM